MAIAWSRVERKEEQGAGISQAELDFGAINSSAAGDGGGCTTAPNTQCH